MFWYMFGSVYVSSCVCVVKTFTILAFLKSQPSYYIIEYFFSLKYLKYKHCLFMYLKGRVIEKVGRYSMCGFTPQGPQQLGLVQREARAVRLHVHLQCWGMGPPSMAPWTHAQGPGLEQNSWHSNRCPVWHGCLLSICLAPPRKFFFQWTFPLKFRYIDKMWISTKASPNSLLKGYLRPKDIALYLAVI